MTIEIDADADVKILGLDEDQVEPNLIEMYQELGNHPAFQGPIRGQPDSHWSAYGPVGFSMPLENTVVPNVVGGDIGCGLTAWNMGEVPTNENALLTADFEIRQLVPMGLGVVHDSGSFHMVNDFPWGRCENKLDAFIAKTGHDVRSVEWFDGYGKEYMLGLKYRGIDMNTLIDSIGTLGAGNHFIEIAESRETGDVWAVVHTGSRKPGGIIANHWQKKATEFTTRRAYLKDVEGKTFTTDRGTETTVDEYIRDDGSIIGDHVRRDFEGTRIGLMFDYLHDLGADPNRNTNFDWLEGEEMYGYIIDMIFAQTYAEVSRELILERVSFVFNATPTEEILSVHNYIDFQDAIIRKGAIRAHEGERGIIPMNASYGSLLVRGKGSPSTNFTAPHGAGRPFSRTEAKKTLSRSEEMRKMDWVVTTNLPIDEAPGAYKDPSLIEQSLGDSVTIEDRIIPLLNIKAD